MIVEYVLLGIAGLSLAVIIALIATRVAAGSTASGPSLLARVFTLWIVSTVFFGSRFASVRFAGLFDLTVERAVFMLLLGLMIARLYQRQIEHGLDHTAELPMLAFLGLCLISMSIHGFQPPRPTMSKPWYVFLEGYLLPCATFYCAKYFLNDEADIRCVVRGLFWIGAFLVVTSIMEGVGLRQYVLPSYINDKTFLIHLGRARGPFLNAAFNGVALCIGLIAGLMLLPLVRFPFSILHYAVLVLFAPAVFFTETRSVYLQFVLIVVGVGVALRTPFPKWKVLAIPCFLIILAILLNIGRLASTERSAGGLAQMEEVSIRFELARKSLELIGQYPFFGVGLAQFRNVGLAPLEEIEYQHNHLLGLASELGLAGLATYLAFLVIILRRLFRLLRGMPEGPFVNDNFVFLTGLALLCNLTSNTFVEPSLHTFANTNFFLFAGIVDKLYNRNRGRIPGRAFAPQPETTAEPA